MFEAQRYGSQVPGKVDRILKGQGRGVFYTDISEAPWYTVEADDKRRTRLNCIAHVLAQRPHKDVIPGKVELPPRKDHGDYERPPHGKLHFVDEIVLGFLYPMDQK